MNKASSPAIGRHPLFERGERVEQHAELVVVEVLEMAESETRTQFVEFDGELEVQYEDSATGARLRHFLNTGSRRLELRFADAPLDWQSGTRGKAHGRSWTPRLRWLPCETWMLARR
jgi:hypothetical protein